MSDEDRKQTSPRPWRLVETWHEVALPSGEPRRVLMRGIASIDAGLPEISDDIGHRPDALLIVEAVNAYDELRTKLREAEARAERLEGALMDVRDAVGDIEYRMLDGACSCRGGWPADNDHDSRCPMEALGRAMGIFAKLYEQTKREMAASPTPEAAPSGAPPKLPDGAQCSACGLVFISFDDIRAHPRKCPARGPQGGTP